MKLSLELRILKYENDQDEEDDDDGNDSEGLDEDLKRHGSSKSVKSSTSKQLFHISSSSSNTKILHTGQSFLTRDEEEALLVDTLVEKTSSLPQTSLEVAPNAST